MINYVIAAWSGMRRGKPRPARTYKKYFNDSTTYLRFHLDKVLELKRSVSHITIVAPFNYETEPKEFQAYLEEMPKRLSEQEGIGITVLRRENEGISFGSFSYAFKELGAEWEYYIFNEDDHIPIYEGFDDALVNHLTAAKFPGLVCAWCRDTKQYKEKPVVGHPLSIAKSSVLKKVAAVNGGALPYKFDTYSGLSADEFSYGFYNAGYGVEDVSKHFNGAFVKGDGRIWWFGETGKPTIVAPIELWELQNRAKLESVFRHNKKAGGP